MRPQGSFVAGSPAGVPACLGMGILIAWAVADGGYAVPTWVPGGLALLGLLAVGLAVAPQRLAELPRALVVALGALAGFTLWSYASMLWADDPAVAWEGANRTLVFLVVFALFSLWPLRPPAALALLALWCLGVGGVALWTVLRLDGAGADLFYDARLIEPVGYINADAALWLSAAWPALVLAGRARTPPCLRAALAATTVLCGALVVLTLSRGAFIAAGLTLVAVLALVPGRARTLTVFAAVMVCVALLTPGLLDLGDELSGDFAVFADPGTVVLPLLTAALACALVVALWAVGEGLRPPAPRTARLARRAIGALGVAAALAGAVVVLMAVGDPVSRAQTAWGEFKSSSYEDVGAGSARLSSLGSSRYDFWRVGLIQLERSPLLGAGADNFAGDYLLERRSDESPRFVHSVVLRTLGQTGLVGTVLLGTFLVTALVAGVRSVRAGPVATRSLAGAALAGFVFVATHAAVDWLWAFPAVAGAGFAMLGIAGAVGRPAPVAAPPRRPRPAGALVAAGVGLVAAAALVPPWLSEREVRVALETWRLNPPAAFAALDRAAGFQPLAARPYLLGGTIALQLDDRDGARRAFAAALEREPRSAYAALQLGALLAEAGDARRAEGLLARAVALDPRNDVMRGALERLRAGEPVDLAQINADIAEQGAVFAR